MNHEAIYLELNVFQYKTIIPRRGLKLDNADFAILHVDFDYWVDFDF